MQLGVSPLGLLARRFCAWPGLMSKFRSILKQRRYGNSSFLLILGLATHALSTCVLPTQGPTPQGLLFSLLVGGRTAQAEETPVKQPWTMERLRPALKKFTQGRSFDRGRRLFRDTQCTACHRMDGEGDEFGPDLSKLDQNLKPAELLESILQPSKQIHRDFQSHQFVLKSGKTVQGIIIAAGVGDVRVIEDPLKSTQPTIVRLDEIDERNRSGVSLMPEGMLDRLDESEVLDLLAYVYARGSDQAPPFKP